jgi:hypothetical protein
MDVPAGGVYGLTLAMDADGVEPLVDIGFPDEYLERTHVDVTIGLTDSGWGVMDVEGSYSLDGGSSWTEFYPAVSATVNRDEYVVNLQDASFSFDVNVSGAPIGGTLMVRAEATDFAGNRGSSEGSFALGVASPVIYTLSVDSSPVSGVTVTVDGVGYESPFAVDLEEGGHTVVVSEEVKEDGVNYTFTGWADGWADPERTVDLMADTDLDALYEEVVAEEPEPEAEPDPEPDPEPDAESEPDSQGGGIPIPYTSVAVGLLLSVVVLFLFRRR